MNIHETTTVELAVKPASECEREAEGGLRPIVWHQLESTAGAVTSTEAVASDPEGVTSKALSSTSNAEAVTSNQTMSDHQWKPLQVRVNIAFLTHMHTGTHLRSHIQANIHAHLRNLPTATTT